MSPVETRRCRFRDGLRKVRTRQRCAGRRARKTLCRRGRQKSQVVIIVEVEQLRARQPKHGVTFISLGALVEERKAERRPLQTAECDATSVDILWGSA